MTYEFKGKGLYDNDSYAFIKECNYPNDKDLNINTCWIGDLETFKEIIDNL